MARLTVWHDVDWLVAASWQESQVCLFRHNSSHTTAPHLECNNYHKWWWCNLWEKKALQHFKTASHYKNYIEREKKLVRQGQVAGSWPLSSDWKSAGETCFGIRQQPSDDLLSILRYKSNPNVTLFKMLQNQNLFIISLNNQKASPLPL